MTSFDKVMIVVHKSNSNSEHTFFTLQVILGHFLKTVSCDMHLILTEHLIYAVSDQILANT